MAKQTFTTGQVLTAAQLTSLQATALGGGATTAKTTSYVLVAADAGTVVQMNSATATTITINTALFAAGDTVQIQNVGAGVCTVTAGTATVSTSSTLALKQYDSGDLYFNTTSAAFFFSTDAADSTSPLTTKGDLYGFSTLDARIPIGTNNQVLTADSAQALGLKWATPAGGGKVLQVVSANYSTQTSNSTSTAADTGLTATITPTSATSKIFVLVSQNGVSKNAGDAGTAVLLRIVRTATTLAEYDAIGYNGISQVLLGLSCSLTFLDSPATTSATTYKTTFFNGGVNAASVTVQRNSSVSTMTLFEIGA